MSKQNRKKKEERCPEELTDEDYEYLGKDSDEEESEDEEELRDTW